MRVTGIVLASTLIALVASAKSYAESDQLIVMECTLGAGRDTIALDLGRRTVTMDRLDSNPNPGSSDIHEGPFLGTVTQITDQQIIFNWNIRHGTETETMTDILNRYSGDLSMTTSDTGFTSQWSCHKQQKQF